MLFLVFLVPILVVDASNRCTHPQGKNGDKVIEGCLQRLCSAGMWQTSLASHLCCYERTAYTINTTISSSMSKDMCVRANIDCVEQTPGQAKTMLKMKNFCKKFVTEEQVDELKELLIQKIPPGASCQKGKEDDSKEREKAMIVTGGSLEASHLAEILLLNGTSLTTCSLPNIPKPSIQNQKIAHTQSGPIACGGWGGSSCLTFSSGLWKETHSMFQKREGHVAWNSPQGVLLMGATYGEQVNTTELLNEDGSSTQQFNMKYETTSSCSIQLEDVVIITGGVMTPQKVSVYNIQGWQEDLPALLEGRYNHGCGHYINTDNIMVYLVAGGTSNKLGVWYIDSTEILRNGHSTWVKAGNLPRQSDGIRGLTFDNKIIMTGGYYYDSGDRYSNKVQSFNPETNSWEDVGRMKNSRSEHGFSIVPAEDFIPYCQ